MSIKLAGVVKFASADIGKLKASLTTGNISQLLMRLVMKAEFIERRSMQNFAHHHDFERMFYEDFMNIDWMDKECAEESMLGQIKKFLARKLAAGMHDIHPEDLEKFTDKIKQQLQGKAQEWQEEAGNSKAAGRSSTRPGRTRSSSSTWQTLCARRSMP